MPILLKLNPKFATECHPKICFGTVSKMCCCSSGSRISRRGGADLVGGRQLPRQLRFEKFVCQNERIWTQRGGARARRRRPPGSATVLFLCFQSTVYAVRAAWSWLQQASICMETHLRNAAAYHQVFMVTLLSDYVVLWFSRGKGDFGFLKMSETKVAWTYEKSVVLFSAQTNSDGNKLLSDYSLSVLIISIFYPRMRDRFWIHSQNSIYSKKPLNFFNNGNDDLFLETPLTAFAKIPTPYFCLDTH